MSRKPAAPRPKKPPQPESADGLTALNAEAFAHNMFQVGLISRAA
jgi:hypothetical protein